MIASFLVGNDFNLPAKFTHFISDDDSNAVNGGFVMRGRFGFDESLEESIYVHIFLGG
ncbi:MAG: hypothetical protein HKUEN02_18880 [Anaerolineaceae bacterium]|nr:MAG: hypothetical protein HKUEN02_18880 [Anaerolineaceae bacterium]